MDGKTTGYKNKQTIKGNRKGKVNKRKTKLKVSDTLKKQPHCLN